MAIVIKEYIGSSMNITESSTSIKRPVNLNENFNEIGPISRDSIIQFIEGIHVGPTRNFTWYTEEALETSIPTWTTPYQRPLIMHHNETDGKTIGRILSVEKLTRNTRSGTPALLFTCNVPDKEGKEQILDGRLKTVSIGVIAHDVRCSICGEQLELDEEGQALCGHQRGATYDDEICYWMIYKMEAKELSYVIVPSDIYAHNTKTVKAEDYLKSSKTKTNLKEGVTINMSEAAKTSLKEGQVIDETVKGNVAGTTEKPKAAEETKPEDNKDNTQGEEKNKETKPEEPKKDEGKPEETKPEEPKKDEEKPKEDPKDKEIAELKKTIERLEIEKESITVNLIAVKKKVDETIAELETAKSELSSEVELKEAVENELANAKLEIREAREGQYNSLRLTLSKPIATKESLTTRSNESLVDAIKDLKEELEGTGKLKHISEASNPSLKTEKDENKNASNVKEEKTTGNINVVEELENMVSNMFNPRFF